MRTIILTFVFSLCLLAGENRAHAQASADFSKFIGTWIEYTESSGLEVLIIKKDGNDYLVSWKQVNFGCMGFNDAKAVAAGDKLKCSAPVGFDSGTVTWFISYDDVKRKIKVTNPKADPAAQDTYYKKPK